MSSFPKVGFPCKVFVKQGNTNEDTAWTRKSNLHIQPLSGDTAKEFYESLVNEDTTFSSKSIRKENKTKIRPDLNEEVPISKSNYSGKDLFKLAQNNEFQVISQLISGDRTIDINATDNFGWTPLMCAACSGSKQAVEVLIKNKADPNICDKFGNSAVKLARKNRFYHIVTILEQPNSNVTVDMKIKRKHIEKVFCNTCDIFHTNIESHESSTLHLFNSNQPKTFYGIPETNKGFQMLLKSGWNKERGLGLRGCGIQFPIKVTKKTDRCGIGGNKKLLFNSVDRHQIMTKRDFTHKKSDKYFERNFRLQFS